MASPVEPSQQPANRAAWPWPDSLDAMIAAPQYHRVLLENEHVRVIESWIPAGAIVPLHSHRWPAVYYTIAAADFVRRDGEGKVLFDSRTVPGMLTASAATWIESIPPHTAENVSSTELHLISVELKQSP
jgi:hypothetical protein